MKVQIIVEKKTKKIISTKYGKGKEHDFKIYKNSTKIEKEIEVEGDRGYQGIAKIHSKSKTPIKKKKNKELSKEDKAFNKKLSSSRVIVEHVLGRLKVFKFVSERYRNRRKRFGLRLNLIAGIYNYELNLR